MNLLKMLSKPAAWASGWTSAARCFSAATGYWLLVSSGEQLSGLRLGRSKWQPLYCERRQRGPLAENLGCGTC
jgi:hypothetical protein